MNFVSRRPSAAAEKRCRKRPNKIIDFAKTYWDSPEGIEKAGSRAIKLRVFHTSEKGKEWSKNQSQRIREFNATKDGKITKKNVGKKVSEWRRNHPLEMQAMGDKLRKWFASDDGKFWKSKRRISLNVIVDRLKPASMELLLNYDDISNSTIGFKRTAINTTCYTCGFESKRTLTSLIGLPRCLACKPFPEVTKQQREIGEFIV
jgi:hypothetical protein